MTLIEEIEALPSNTFYIDGNMWERYLKRSDVLAIINKRMPEVEQTSGIERCIQVCRELSREYSGNPDDKTLDEIILDAKKALAALQTPKTEFSNTIQELIDFVDRNVHYEYGKRLTTSTAVQLLRDIEIDCNRLKAENDRLKQTPKADGQGVEICDVEPSNIRSVN